MKQILMHTIVVLHNIHHIQMACLMKGGGCQLFKYIYCFAEHNLINWTGSLATVDSHCCSHTKFSNDVYRHVPNCCR